MDISLPGVFSRVNQYLCERSGEDRYATVFYGILDKMGRFEYVNAGHVPPIVRRKSGELEGLGSANFPVGMFAEAEYQSARVTLEPGEYLVIYTDGVSEAANPQNMTFVVTNFTGMATNITPSKGCLLMEICALSCFCWSKKSPDMATN